MSDSRKGIKIEIRTQQFPTVKLTKSLMGELLDDVYGEYEKLKEAKASFWILVTDKKVDRAYTHKDDFLKEFDSFMKSFGVIKISLVSPIKSISLELWNTYGNNKPIYSITSNDSDWSRNIR